MDHSEVYLIQSIMFLKKEIQTLTDFPQIGKREQRIIGNALDTKRFVLQNLRRSGFHAAERVTSIPFDKTRNMGMLPATINWIGRFLENKYAVVAPVWES